VSQIDSAATLSGRRVLITGADGFIGSHLVESALAAGATVRALALYTSFGTAGWLDQSKPFQAALADGQAELVLGDIRDGELVDAAVAGVDLVLHLAALIAIPYSYVAPRSYVDTNITGTLNVLEAVRRHDVPRMINTSTSEVYGTPDTIPITETHPLRGQSPYSATKIAADKLCEAFARSFETPVVTLRPFNTYGPRQSARAVIPTVLSQLLSGASQLRVGATSPRRDFTFVTDTCAGFVRAAVADLDPGETVQLGTGSTYSIGEVIQMCLQVTGSTAEVVTDEDRIRPAGSEVEVLLSDPTKAKDLLGWSPTIGLDEGLRRTAEWLRPQSDPQSAGRYHR
jgi:UDP-glucose 4-epimerase